MTLSLDEIRRVLDNHATSPDAPTVDGLHPELLARPKSREELGGLLARLCEHRVPVLVRGSGTRAEWGNPARAGRVVISSAGLDGIRELDADEGVVCAGAGTPIASLQRAAEESGWTFPLDPPGGSTTLGGTLAADGLGPRHTAYGRARDLVLGLEVCLGDGASTRSGGRVVKNVTGYDLAKLHIGALGTLGIISEAWLKLKPAPEQTRVMSGVAPDAPAVLEAARLPGVRAAAWLDAELAAAVEPGRELAPRVVVELAERGDVVETAETRLAERFGLSRAEPAVLERVRAAQGSRPEPVGMRFRIAALPSRLASATASLGAVGAAWMAYPASGLLYARFRPGAGDAHSDLGAAAVRDAWSRVATIARDAGGHARLEAAPIEARRVRDVFGEAPAGQPLFRELKTRFDPAGILNPGRFSGGI